MSYSKELAIDLSQFLNNTARPDVRLCALKHICSISNSTESIQLMEMEDFLIETALFGLFIESSLENSIILTIFVNVAAISSEFSRNLIENERVLHKCFQLVKDNNNVDAARLLANLSRRFPARIKTELDKYWENYIKFFINCLNKTDEEDLFDYIGYLVVNLTTIKAIRCELVEKYLTQLLPLTSSSVPLKRRFIAIDIIRNISFEDELHSRLLDSDDEFLTAILAPLCDETDVLDEDETQLLPLGLQYWDKKRDSDEFIQSKIIETLYQICATKIGRTTLRSKGVYPLLRELDKAISQPKKAGELKFIDQENTLHALIGILIKHESEMEVPQDLESIRKLK